MVSQASICPVVVAVVAVFGALVIVWGLLLFRLSLSFSRANYFQEATNSFLASLMALGWTTTTR